jgi:uncharacterized cupin superfamily protein
MAILKLPTSTAAASTSLEDWGTVGLPLSEPSCRLRGTRIAVGGAGSPEVGIWECSPGRFRRQVRNAEAIHVISGAAVFTPDDGPAVRLTAGDVLHFEAESMGVWDIETAMRKLYVLFTPVEGVDASASQRE